MVYIIWLHKVLAIEQPAQPNLHLQLGVFSSLEAHLSNDSNATLVPKMISFSPVSSPFLHSEFQSCLWGGVLSQDWMLDIMASCMRLCGLDGHEWPNSCNLNLYLASWSTSKPNSFNISWHSQHSHSALDPQLHCHLTFGLPSANIFFELVLNEYIWYTCN